MKCSHGSHCFSYLIYLLNLLLKIKLVLLNQYLISHALLIGQIVSVVLENYRDLSTESLDTDPNRWVQEVRKTDEVPLNLPSWRMIVTGEANVTV